MADCLLDREFGILTPTMRAVLDSRAALREEAVEARRRHEQRQAAAARQAEQRAKEQALEVEKAARRRAYAEAKEAERRAAWQSDPRRGRVIDCCGSLPAVVTDRLPSDRGVFAYFEHWHAVLFEDLVLRRRPGDTFVIGRVYRTLFFADIALHKDGKRRSEAVLGYLDHLERHGYIKIDGYHRPIKVLATSPHAAAQVLLEGATRQSQQSAPPPNVGASRGGDGNPSNQSAEVVGAAPPVRPPKPKYTDPLSGYDAHRGYVENRIPGLSPLLRWHPHVLRAVEDSSERITKDALREALPEVLVDVSDEDLEAFLECLSDSQSRPARLSDQKESR
jgi:hypothetical protein